MLLRWSKYSGGDAVDNGGSRNLSQQGVVNGLCGSRGKYSLIADCMTSPSLTSWVSLAIRLANVGGEAGLFIHTALGMLPSSRARVEGPSRTRDELWL